MKDNVEYNIEITIKIYITNLLFNSSDAELIIRKKSSKKK